MPQTHLPPASLPQKLYYLFLLYLCKALWSTTFTLLPPFLPRLFPPPTSKKYYPCLPRHPVYLYFPPSSSSSRQKLPLYIDIHGGSFTYGTPTKDALYCHTLSTKLRCIVASISYRKAPRHTFPTQLHDCAALITALLADATLPIDPARIVLGGFSAGAMIALGLVQLPTFRGRFRGVVAWYPKVDGTLTIAEEAAGVPENATMRLFKPAFAWGMARGLRLDEPLASAAFMPLEAVPERLLVCAGRDDMFCEESRRFVERVVTERFAGVKEVEEGGKIVAGGGALVGWWVPGMGHSFTHKVARGNAAAKARHREQVQEVVEGVMGWVGDVFEGRI